MTSKTTNKFSPEIRTRAVRMVLDHEGEHASRWASVTSIAAKLGCTPRTLNDWVKKAEVDSGKRAAKFFRQRYDDAGDCITHSLGAMPGERRTIFGARPVTMAFKAREM
jgi:transposase-like protein